MSLLKNTQSTEIQESTHPPQYLALQRASLASIIYAIFFAFIICNDLNVKMQGSR